MILYFIIMLSVGLLILGISLQIYNGKTNLIHSYHQTKVKDLEA